MFDSRIFPALPDTFMSRICHRIFDYESVDSTQVIEITCTNWFSQVVQHCTEIFKRTDRPLVWFVRHLENFKNFMFRKNFATALMDFNSPISIRPNEFTETDCKEFFIELGNDYVDVVPKYRMRLNESLHISSVIGAVIFIVLLFYLFWKTKKFSRNILVQREIRETVNDEKCNSLEKMNKENLRSLKLQLAELYYIRMVNPAPLRCVCGAPMFIFRTDNSLLCLQSNLLSEREMGYLTSLTFTPVINKEMATIKNFSMHELAILDDIPVKMLQNNFTDTEDAKSTQSTVPSVDKRLTIKNNRANLDRSVRSGTKIESLYNSRRRRTQSAIRYKIENF